jgi:hypothetical protein
VDIDEFVGLYSKIKSGEVDGLAGYGFFESKKTNMKRGSMSSLGSRK